MFSQEAGMTKCFRNCLLPFALFGVSVSAFGQGFPNVPRTEGELLTPLLVPNQGRTAIIAWHNGWIYTAPEAPSSQPGSDIQARRWNFADLSNVIVEEVLGTSPMPILAHGYLKMGNNLVLGSNWPPEAPWSFEATAPNVNVRTETPGLEGVWNRGHLYQPWGATTFWSYSDVNFPLELTFGGVVQASWDHLALTGVVGFPFIVGNTLIMAADQTRTGVATYDISDPMNPVLLDTLKTGGPGGYWPSLYGADGQLLIVFPYRTGGNGIRVVDVTDPSDMQFVADVPLPGDACMYAQFQDEFCFVGNHKVDMRTLTSVLSLDSAANGIDTSQFLLPLGNLVVTGGVGPGQGMAVWAHQAEADTRGPSVGYHVPRAGQTNYPVNMPISILIHETIESPSIEDGVSFIVRPVGGSQVAGQWVLAFDDTLTFTPDSPLQADTTYEVIFPEGGIKDAAGNGMEAYSFTFSTGTEVTGNLPPSVDSWTATPYPVAPGVDVAFEATGSDPDMDAIEYRFDFGDGTPKTAWGANTTAMHSYAAEGHFQAKVQVRDATGSISTDTTIVTVTSATLGGARPTNSGPIACDETNRRVWTVNPDNDTVTAIDADTLAVEFEVPVGADPRNVAIDADGNAWITCHGADEIRVVSPLGAPLETIELAYGDGPFGVVISADGADAWVSLMNAGEVRRFSTTTRSQTAMVSTGPTPRALALTADGANLYVSRFLSPAAHGEIWRIDTASEMVAGTTILYKFGWDAHRDGTAEGMGVANYLVGLTLSPDGSQLLVACNKPNTDKGAFSGLDLDSDNTVRNLVCIVDTGSGQMTDSLDVDNSDSSSAIAFSPLGDYFLTSLQGNNEIAIFDTLSVNSEAGLGGMISRKAVGAAPQGICIDTATNRAFVKNFLDRSVSVLELGALFQSGSVMIADSEVPTVATESLMPGVLNGKRIFYNAGDPRMSAEGYMSCATCHLDGGHDGRVWDFTGRGEGFRNTTTLRGRSGMGHGNVHWSANFDEIQDFENDIRNGFGGTGFLTDEQFTATSDPLGTPKAGLNSDLDDLAAYVASLDDDSVPQSPYRAVDGEPTSEAVDGAALFQSLSCHTCHSGTTLQDGLSHDVGTLRSSSGQRLGADLTGIDTPTLRGLWAGAPYLHDGSARTLEEVFTVAGGTSYPAENGTLSGAAGLQSPSSIFTNYDQIPHHGGVVDMGNGGSVLLENVDGGSGGIGAIEVRYATGWFNTAILSVNGVDFPLNFQPGVNNPTWRTTDYRVIRVENVTLSAGPSNTVELTQTSVGQTTLDDFVVATADEMASAQVHHQVADLPANDYDSLLAFLRQLDGNAIPGAPPLPAPDAVTGLVLQYDPELGLVALSWDPLPEADHFEIWRGSSDDPLSMVLVDTTASTFYEDSSAPPGQSHFYRVRGVNASGPGAWEPVAAPPVEVPETSVDDSVVSPRPDLTIGKKWRQQKGENVYSNGAGQAFFLRIGKRRIGQAVGWVGNDSTSGTAIYLRGSGGKRGSRASWYLFTPGRQNVTAAVRTGAALVGPMTTAERWRYMISVRFSKKARKSIARLEGASGGFSDATIFRLRR